MLQRMPSESRLDMCSARSSLLTPGAVASAKTYPASHSKSDLGSVLLRIRRAAATSLFTMMGVWPAHLVAAHLRRVSNVAPVGLHVQISKQPRVHQSSYENFGFSAIIEICVSRVRYSDLVGAVDSGATEKLAAFLLCQVEYGSQPDHVTQNVITIS